MKSDNDTSISLTSSPPPPSLSQAVSMARLQKSLKVELDDDDDDEIPKFPLFGSATRRALRIPEILRRVFESSTRKDNVSSNALVSATWSSEALAVLWRDVRDFRRLLKLLAPLTFHHEEGANVFTRPLEPADWDRFDKYAWRVHRLSDDHWNSYSKSIFTSMALSRPLTDLLPNLRTLVYDGGIIEFIPLFLHEKIRNLSLSVEHQYPSNERVPSLLKPILPYIPVRVPYLESLQLFAQFECDDIESTLADTFRGLSELKDLTMPSHWLTHSVTTVIASQKNLESLHMVRLDKKTDHQNIFSTSLGATSFPVLATLHLVIRFSRASLCLSQNYRASTLTELSISSPQMEDVEEYGRIIKVVTSHCPKLESFSLATSGSAESISDQLSTPITIDTLQLILRCSDIRTLRLHHHLPFQLNPPDVVTIAEALPRLRILHLNHHPDITSKPTLNICALPALISLCPELEELGLYLDASADHLPSVANGLMFKRLKMLAIGDSPITSPVEIATLLSRILPEGCRIEVLPQPEQSNLTYNHWGLVASLVPAFIAVRKEALEQSGRQ